MVVGSQDCSLLRVPSTAISFPAQAAGLGGPWPPLLSTSGLLRPESTAPWELEGPSARDRRPARPGAQPAQGAQPPSGPPPPLLVPCPASPPRHLGGWKFRLSPARGGPPALPREQRPPPRPAPGAPPRAESRPGQAGLPFPWRPPLPFHTDTRVELAGKLCFILFSWFLGVAAEGARRALPQRRGRRAVGLSAGGRRPRGRRRRRHGSRLAGEAGSARPRPARAPRPPRPSPGLQQMPAAAQRPPLPHGFWPDWQGDGR